MADEKLKWAVQILLDELRIDEKCLKVMANGYSPDHSCVINDGSGDDWVNPKCKIQLSQVVAQSLLDAGLGESEVYEDENVVPRLLKVERWIVSLSQAEARVRGGLLIKRIEELHLEAAHVVTRDRPYVQLRYIFEQIGEEVFKELALTLPWNEIQADLPSLSAQSLALGKEEN